MLAYELKEILKEIGEVSSDNEIIEKVYKLEKLLELGEVDFTKTILYALWAFKRISQGLIACVGIDGICTLLRGQNEIGNLDYELRLRNHW